MEKVNLEHPESSSLDIVAENLKRLKKLFPETFIEGKVDFDVLRQLLGYELNDSKEKYGLEWPGKRDAWRLALAPSTGTLRPCPSESVDWNQSKNLMIEGDNLEVLKLLQKSYSGRVKFIYIDPPYNSGKDFIYDDNFHDNIHNYLQLTGQIDGEKRRLTSNPESSGRFHTNWLNMMLPRVKLARELLQHNGVMFISIDDREVATLRCLCDQVFGEENFFAQLPWQSRTSVQNDTDLSVQHEYLVGYARNRRKEHRRLKENNSNQWFEMPSFAAFPEPADIKRYRNPDGDPRGPWKTDPFDAPNIRENLTYPIENPVTGEEHWPPQGRCWRTEESRYEHLLQDGRIVFGGRGGGRPQLKVFYEEKKLYGEVPTSWFDGNKYGTTMMGTKELQSHFQGVSPFSFPKPTKLLAELFKITARDEDIILDFFAGSGTTAEAVMSYNCNQGAKLRYILVQLPEILDPAQKEQKVAADICDKLDKPRNIAEITKERIRRASIKISQENPDFDGDLGFRVFKLDTSNIRAWNPHPDQLEEELLSNLDHIEQDRTEQDILYELLLKFGLGLCASIKTKKIVGKNVHVVGDGSLIICLAQDLLADEVEPLATGISDWIDATTRTSEAIVVFRDSAFADDIAKTNLVAILGQKGLGKVRSL